MSVLFPALLSLHLLAPQQAPAPSPPSAAEADAAEAAKADDAEDERDLEVPENAEGRDDASPGTVETAGLVSAVKDEAPSAEPADNASEARDGGGASSAADATAPGPDAAAPADEEPEGPPRLLVLPPKAVKVGEEAARIVGSLLVVELGAIDAVEVTSTDDLARMLEVEAERQALGCDDSSCLAEIAGAMGASLVVYGDLGQLGETLVLTLNLFDSDTARAAGRTTVQAATPEGIADQLRPAIAKLLSPTLSARGLSLPQGYLDNLPTRASPSASTDNALLFPASLALAGGAGVVIGAVVAIAAGASGYALASSAAATSQAAVDDAEWTTAGTWYLVGWILYVGGPIVGALVALAGGAAVIGGGGWALLASSEVE